MPCNFPCSSLNFDSTLFAMHHKIVPFGLFIHYSQVQFQLLFAFIPTKRKTQLCGNQVKAAAYYFIRIMSYEYVIISALTSFQKHCENDQIHTLKGQVIQKMKIL